MKHVSWRQRKKKRIYEKLLLQNKKFAEHLINRIKELENISLNKYFFEILRKYSEHLKI